jgi:hypothetical protein
MRERNALRTSPPMRNVCVDGTQGPLPSLRRMALSVLGRVSTGAGQASGHTSYDTDQSA